MSGLRALAGPGDLLSRRILAAAILASTIVCGCSVAQPAVKRSLAGVPGYPAICSTVVPEIASLWSPGASGLVGYGDVPTLAQAPSLYETAWSLKIAAAMGARVGRLVPAEARAAMLSVLSDNGRISAGGLDRITEVNLAAGALAQLGAPDRTAVEAALEPLRHQGEYAPAAGAAPSWAATYLAVAALSGAGARIPSPVISSLRGELNSLHRTADVPSDVFGVDLPVLAALVDAGMAPAVLKASPWVRQDVTDWWAIAGQQAASGPVLGYLVTLRQIMASLGMPRAPLSAREFDQLGSSAGYYKVFPTDTEGDPQTTYYAIYLGAPVSRNAVLGTLAGGVEPQGWVSLISTPSLTSTFDAVVADAACGVHPHAGQIRTYIDSALDAAAHMSPGSRLAAATSGAMGQLCWMSRYYGITVAPPVKRADAAAIGAASAATRAGSAAAASTAAVLASDLQACGLAPSRDLARRLQAAGSGPGPVSAIGAYDTYVVATVTDDVSLLRLARTGFAGLYRGNAYRFDGTARQADLISTCYGITVMDASSGARLKVIGLFETSWGPGLEEPASEVHAVPEIDLVSLSLSLAAADDTVPGTLILG
jgi:hypothetical protein